MLDDLLSILLSLPAMAFLGLVVGSFLNVVIHRVPIMVEREVLTDAMEALADEASWARAGVSDAQPAVALEGMYTRLRTLPRLNLNEPSSHCPDCRHRIRWFENVPGLSWFALKGKCSKCGAAIAARYVVVELAIALLFATLAWRMGPHLATLAWAGFVATVVAASLIDWETTLLPDALTLPLLWAGLLAATAGLTVEPGTAVLGAAAGYALPWGISALSERVSGKAAMAPGDFKLLAAIGAWMGGPLVAPVLALALIVGAGAVVLRAGRASLSGRYFPFGPYLGVVAIVFALTGPSLIAGWL